MNVHWKKIQIEKKGTINGFTISVSVLILPAFRQLLLRNKIISSISLVETSERSVQTADNKSKFTSQAPQVTLVLFIFKLIFYFNSSIISNQIKYYLAINTENFLQVQYGFYRQTLPIHYQLWWLVIERACTKNLRNLISGTWLFGASWWKVIKALSLYEIVYINLFFFFDRKSSDEDWYLTSWTSTMTQIHVTCHR